MNHRTDILELRTALDVLRQTPGQLVETDVEVDPEAELSGVYRYVGAGGTVMRPPRWTVRPWYFIMSRDTRTQALPLACWPAASG